MRGNGLGNMGYIMLATLYLFIGIGSIFSTAILKRFGIKNCLVAGAFGHFIFIFANALPAYRHEYFDDHDTIYHIFFFREGVVKTILILSVILNGLGASILWVAQGEYFSKCTNEEGKGFFFGFFWSVYQGSQIFGSLFGSYIFRFNLNKTVFSVVMSFLAMVGALSFCFIRKPFVHCNIVRKNIHLAKEEDYYTNEGNSSVSKDSLHNSATKPRRTLDRQGSLEQPRLGSMRPEPKSADQIAPLTPVSNCV